MSRINTNVPSLIAARIFNQQNEKLAGSLERLATGLRINRGKDDPAGLIASERLRTDMRAIDEAINNANRADQIISTTEGALNEVSSLLLEVEGLVDQSANQGALSTDEIKANQLQIDSILDTINRIANTTAFAGKKLLNGDLDYTTSSVTSTQLAAVTVNSARIADGATRTVTVDVTTSAQTGYLRFAASGTAATNGVTIQIGGNKGTETLTFAGSAATATMVTAINQSKDLTGVSATASTNNSALLLHSTEYGSDQFVSVSVLSGTFALQNRDASVNSAGKDFGVDAVASISGTSVTGDGRDLSLNSASLSVDITLATTFVADTGTTSTFGITGGGATFSLAPELSLAGRQSVGVASMTTGNLGKGGVGFISSLGSGQANEMNQKNFLTAQNIIRSAEDKVAKLRGRLGSFQKDTLQSTINSLQIALENTTAAESAIRDTDFAEETSKLTRSQILVASGTSTLQLANATPQNVLALLG